MPEYINITTAQNVNIKYTLASIGDRVVARLIDGFIKAAYALVVFMAMARTDFFIIMIAMIPVMLYSLLFEVFNNGQTPGKSIMKITVASADGAPVRFSQYLIRWLLRIVDEALLTSLVGLIAIAVSKKHQRLGDMAANTIVISLKSEDGQKGAYVKLKDDYVPTYPQAASLSNKDVAILKRVIRDDSDRKHHFQKQAKEKMEQQLGIRSGAMMNSREFLILLVKDYNYYMQNGHSPNDELDPYE